MKRKPTDLGKFLKWHSNKNYLTLSGLADRIGMTHSYMSAINVGKKGFPDNKIDKTISILKLNAEEEKKFVSLVQDWKTSFTFKVVGLSDEKRILVATFVRKLPTLPENKVKALLTILGE